MASKHRIGRDGVERKRRKGEGNEDGCVAGAGGNLEVENCRDYI